MTSHVSKYFRTSERTKSTRKAVNSHVQRCYEGARSSRDGIPFTPPRVGFPGGLAREGISSVTSHAGISSESTLTPLESLYFDLKKKHPNVVLLIETGYLFRLFSEDADVAAKELNFNVSSGRNVRTTSLPKQTMHVHVRRLVAKGYKVGIVTKMETALMRAADNDTQESLFRRELTNLYTKSTLVGEGIDADGRDGTDEIDRNEDTNFLMCLFEVPMENAVRVGMLAVSPLSGDIVYDYFVDTEKRGQLERRFAQIKPVEVLVPNSCMTDETYRFIEAISKSSLYDEKVRIEKLPDEHFRLDDALIRLRDFYETNLDCFPSINLLNVAMELEPPIICCLSAVLLYLKDFKLDYVLKLINFKREFSSRTNFLYLDPMTSRSLELFETKDGRTRKGSLVWILDQTRTTFGSRTMRNWIGNPLRSKTEIRKRLTAVEEITSNSVVNSLLNDILQKLPDLEQGITAIFHKKCGTSKYLKIVSSFVRLKGFLNEARDRIRSEVKSSLLKSLFESTTYHLEGVETLISNIDVEAAKLGNKIHLFKDLTPFPDALEVAREIGSIETKLKDLIPSIRKLLRVDEFAYSSFKGKEYVVIVNDSSVHKIPSDWITISRSVSKICCRSPEMNTLVAQLRMLQDHLAHECHLAWLRYLEYFKMFYQQCRQVVSNLATLDCLLSLATVAKAENLVRPEIANCDKTLISIKGGYHIVTRKLLLQSKDYIANDTNLGGSFATCMIIGGANMGGKSCYAKQVAIIALMAQIGSFVPAETVTLTPLDGIFARSGVRDSIMTGKSSFCVEAEQVATILKQATSRSLVVLDGFGRSTSDSDGSAIAIGTLRFCLTDIECLVIVISHFTEVAKLEKFYPTGAKNYHMSVLIHGEKSNCGASSHVKETVTYLYNLMEGIGSGTYARNVARLAGIDDDILERAANKAAEIETRLRKAELAVSFFHNLHNEFSSLSDLSTSIRSLKSNEMF